MSAAHQIASSPEDPMNPAPSLPAEVEQVVLAWTEDQPAPPRPVVVLAAELTADCLGRPMEIHSVVTNAGQMVPGRWLFTLERMEVVTRESAEKPGTFEHLYRLVTAGAAPVTYMVTADTPVILYGPLATDVRVVALPSGAYIAEGGTARRSPGPTRGAYTSAPTPAPPWDDKPTHSEQATPTVRQSGPSPSGQPTTGSGQPEDRPGSPTPPPRPPQPAGPGGENKPEPTPDASSQEPPPGPDWSGPAPLPPQMGGSDWRPRS